MNEARFIKNQGFDSVRTLDLSPVQAQLCEIPAGEILAVFGSPGSGKTTGLVSRFLALVASGLSPDQIIVIAATRESANSLRDQLALEYQGATSGPLAKTLTSLAFSLLAREEKLAGRVAPVLVSGSEQDQLLKQVITEQGTSSWPKNIDERVLSLTGFRTELRDLIAVCLEHDITPLELSKLGEKQNLQQWVAAAESFERYLALLASSNQTRFDSAALLQKAAKLISAANQLPEQLGDVRAILVDDAQELTPAAAELLFQLTRFGAGLTLCGDPDVSTLGFRAANPKAMSELVDRVANRANLPSTRLFLEPTHAVRSPAISEALAKISSQIEVAKAGRQRKGLNPPAQVLGDSQSLIAKVFRSESAELGFIASEIRKRHLFEGVAWSKIAVVARSRPALERLALALSAESVPVRIVGSASALRNYHASGQLLRLARYALAKEPLTIEIITEILTSEFVGLDHLGLQRLRRSLRKASQDAIGPEDQFDQQSQSGDELLLEAIANPNALSLIRTREARAAESIARLMQHVAELGEQPGTTAEAVLWELVAKTRVLENWRVLSRGVSEVAAQAGANLDSMLSLFATAARFSERNPTALALEFIQDQLDREIPEDSLALNNKSAEEVLLLTPSGLIGRRFDTVLLPGLSEGVWPNLKPRSSLLGAMALDALLAKEITQVSELKKSELPGELRMLNKAVGAASSKLIMTATEKEEDQLSQFLPLVHGSYPEPESYLAKTYTLRSMVGDLRRELASGKSDNPFQVALGLARLAKAGVPGASPSNWYGMLPLSTSEPLTDLSNQKLQIRPSQLEKFLKCPLHWFIETHGGSEGSFSASLGSLVHEVLEVTESSEREDLEKLKLSRWNSLEFESDWLEDLGKRQAGRMLSNLAQYLKEFETGGGTVLAREQNFNFELGNVQVRGQVDRIEQLPDGKIVIVDLKTGKLAASNQETATNPQLALYQMAVLEGGFEEIDAIKPELLAGAKLLVVGGQKYQEREQPAMTDQESGRFRKILLDASEGMSKPVFVAQLSGHCQQEREYGSCSLHLTKAVSYVG